MKFQNPYRTEADLCDAFVEVVRESGWRSYPECGGFDILIVNPDGIQIGIEAKLRCNLDVVAQAVPFGLRAYKTVLRPHYIGVLVPRISSPLRTVCAALRLHVWDHKWITLTKNLSAALRPRDNYLIDAPRIELPEVAIQTSAGCPSPKTMSGWRINALRACILLETKGYLTRADIIAAGCDPARWTQYWMMPDGDEMGANNRRIKRYVPNPRNSVGMPSKGYELEMEILRGES